MNILLVGCCKNIENNIDNIKKGFYNLKDKINNCKGIFYENNSTDNTALLLKEWEEKEENIKCICEKFTDEELLNMCKSRTYDNKPCRIEIITIARNKLLDEIEKDIYKDFKYVIMFDMDFKEIIPVDNILKVINKYTYDALICYGTDKYNNMYDTYAFRTLDFPFGPEIIGDDFLYFDKLIKVDLLLNKKEDLIPIISGFNGLAIIKKEALKNIRYSPYPTKELNKFYNSIINNKKKIEEIKEKCIYYENNIFNNNFLLLQNSINDIYNKYNNFNNFNLYYKNKTHIDGKLQGIFLHGTDDLFYTNCSGYNFPIVCEHINFFLRMRENGYKNIYLCKELLWSNIWQT